MELILWRHAEAEDTTPDSDRALTVKGHKQAEKMAAWLQQHLPANTHILVSPAKRAQQTAKALGLDFSTLDTLAPGASAQAILDATDWPSGNAVLVVGHQPTLGLVAARIMTGKTHYWCIKKSAVWWLSNRVRGEEEQCILRAVVSPDLK